jgi:hypothetical protein
VERVDEDCFLFGVELGADPDFLVGVVAGVERDGLNHLGWFEVAGVPLRVGRLLGEAFQVGDEGLGLGEGLSVLHAFHVAFVRVAVRGSDSDDPDRARHLELEVGVVGDGHELGVAWPSQHRVVVKGKCALGPFLSILVIKCQHKCLSVKVSQVMDKVQIKSKGMFLDLVHSFMD